MLKNILIDERAGTSVEYGFLLGISGLSAFYAYVAKKVEDLINEFTTKFFYIYAGPP
ncbi:MAG: hypothetical protein ABIM78_05160 [candidate division WOR-3 bacterium]